MSNILGILKELVDYYNVTRGVGHTTRMLNGVWEESDYRKIDSGFNPSATTQTVILTHFSMVDKLKKNIKFSDLSHKINVLPFPCANYDSVLRGHRSALLIDNSTLHTLFSASANEIESLQIIQDKLDIQIEKLNNDKKLLVNRIDKLEKENHLLIEKSKNTPQENSYITMDDISIKGKEIESVEVNIKYKQ